MNLGNVNKVRLTPEEIKSIVSSVIRISEQFGVNCKAISLFGSRTNLNARGGDIDCYVEIEIGAVLNSSAFVRELKIELQDKLGEQKLDIVVNDGVKDLGPFKDIIFRSKIDLWTSK